MIETKFKHTDIGSVPQEWEVTSFGEAFKKLNAASYTWDETTQEGDCAYLHYGYIHTRYHDHLDVEHDELPYVSKSKANRFAKLQDGDLIMLNASEDYDGVNDCVEIMNCNKALIAGQHTIPLRPNKDKLQKGFIGYIPSIPAVKMQLIENAVGTKVYGVTNEVLQTVLFSLPPLPEQRRIASALMKVDGLIANLDKLIAKKQAIKKGAMQELLTGKKRLPGFKGEWKEVRLGDVSCFIGGGTPNTSISKYWKGTIPWVSSSDLNEDDIFHISRTRFITKQAVIDSATKLCPNGTIHLVTRVGLGKLAISFTEECTSQDFCNIVLDTTICDISFVALSLLPIMQKRKEEAQGTTIKGITVNDVSTIPIALPPLPEQRAIAHVLSVMDSDISLLEQKREKMKAVKQGMMHDLLTGRIRLTE